MHGENWNQTESYTDPAEAVRLRLSVCMCVCLWQPSGRRSLSGNAGAAQPENPKAKGNARDEEGERERGGEGAVGAKKWKFSSLGTAMG